MAPIRVKVAVTSFGRDFFQPGGYSFGRGLHGNADIAGQRTLAQITQHDSSNRCQHATQERPVCDARSRGWFVQPVDSDQRTDDKGNLSNRESFSEVMACWISWSSFGLRRSRLLPLGRDERGVPCVTVTSV